MVWRCTSCSHRNLGRHTVCQGCGDPKDASEPYEMPGDTAAAATVTDPSLLKLALAGANWRCRYCRSDQRALDGTCKSCGASQGEAMPRTRSVAQRAGPHKAGVPWRVALFGVAGAVLLLLVVSLTLAARGSRSATGSQRMGRVVALAKLPFRDQPCEVTSARWIHTVVVERYHRAAREGFEEARPKDALDVVAVEKRFHHTERVLVGYDTVPYTVTEPDGYDTETYTEQESCGEDCTDLPENCQERCTSNENGFATCRTECSGGGQRCSTRYCTVTKTRQVPRTKQVTYTRQEPRYEDQARDAMWYRWRVWAWEPHRTLEKSGQNEQTPVWPDKDELKPAGKLGVGEQERELRRARYFAELSVLGEPSRKHELELESADELPSYPAGRRVMLRVWDGGRVQQLGR